MRCFFNLDATKWWLGIKYITMSHKKVWFDEIRKTGKTLLKMLEQFVPSMHHFASSRIKTASLLGASLKKLFWFIRSTKRTKERHLIPAWSEDLNNYSGVCSEISNRLSRINVDVIPVEWNEPFIIIKLITMRLFWCFRTRDCSAERASETSELEHHGDPMGRTRNG